MSDTDYNKCICETCGGNCGCDAEIERLRKQCVFLRDRSAEGQQLLHRALAHIDTTQSLYKEVRGHLYPQDQEEQR